MCFGPWRGRKAEWSAQQTRNPLVKSWAIVLIPVPPGWGLTFSSYSWRLNKIAFTPEDFRKKWVFSLKNTGLVYPWRISWKLKLDPKRIFFCYITLPVKRSSLLNLLLKNSIGPQPGGGGVRILNAITRSLTASWILLRFSECNVLATRVNKEVVVSC